MVPIIFKWIHLLNKVHCGLINGYVIVWNNYIIIGLKFRQWPFFINTIMVINIKDVIYNWMNSYAVYDPSMPQLKRCLPPLCGEAMVVPLVDEFCYCPFNSW